MKEPELPEEYEDPTIEDFFENLYAAEQTNSPTYNLWQGQLYDNLRSSTYVSDVEAMNVSRLLNRGEVEEAEELTEELLEPEQE